jgi:hypothetical protein
MYRRTLLTALCMFTLLTLPLAGRASMTQLTDGELDNVTGQAGSVSLEVAGDVTRMTFDTTYDNIPVLHGLLNLGDVTIQGTIETKSDSSVSVSQVTSSSLTGLTGIGGIMSFGMTGLGGMSMGTHYIDAAMDINRLTIGSIRIGQDLTGPSLGSLDILGLHTDIKGTISLSVR